MKRLFCIALLFSIILCWSGLSFAETNVQDLENQLQKLQKQMEELNAIMKAQKAEIEALQNRIKETQKEKPTVAEVPATAPAEIKTSSKYKINFYGKIKFDGIYDTNNMGKDEFITYVPHNANGEDKATFNVRDTRFGIAIEGPALNGWVPRGRFETDFYGSDAVNSSNGALRIRLAYIDLEKAGTLIRVGQDWTPIANLNPNTLDFAVMGYNGNLWNRVPQITVKQNFGSGLEGLFTIYRYRWSDDDDTTAVSKTRIDTQIHLPWIGGKIAYSTNLLDPDKKAYFALGGAVRNGESNDNDVTPYLTALELKIPLSIVELTGEAYMGQGLGIEYYRHSGGGVFNTDGHAILTRGGFLQACVKPIKNVQLNLGYGLDNPKNEDVGSEFYRQSEYLFGNIQVQIMKDITAGIEMNYVETEWEHDKQYGTRYSTSLIYTW